MEYLGQIKKSLIKGGKKITNGHANKSDQPDSKEHICNQWGHFYKTCDQGKEQKAVMLNNVHIRDSYVEVNWKQYQDILNDWRIFKSKYFENKYY